MPLKKTLIISGHPNRMSFNFVLAKAYKKGFIAAGDEPEEIMIHEFAI